MPTTVFIPSELLEVLCCSKCNCYLSVFPIYIKIEGENVFCGRCQITNEAEYIRDDAYEGVAQFLLFPCSQHKFGCTEQLTPQDMKNHELFCTYRKQNCPTKNYTNCEWQGPNSELKEHFSTTHEDLLVEDERFKVEFETSIKKNLLFPYNDELFLVKMEIDSRDARFVCSVEHVVLHKISADYHYYIQMETEDGSYQHKFEEFTTLPHNNYKTKVFLKFFKEHLDNASEMFARIVITDASVFKRYKPKNEEQPRVDIDWGLLKELECPICMDYMLPPIFQCIGGHSICSSCKPKLHCCPTCRQDIKNTKNFILESLTSRLTYPCKYLKQGCNIALKAVDIRGHEDLCAYGPYRCPLFETLNCDTECSQSDILIHIESEHGGYILKSDKVTVLFDYIKFPKIERYSILKAFKNVFKVCFEYEGDKFHWAVQLVGPAEQAKQYKFEIDIVDNSDKKNRMYMTGSCVPLTKNEDCFNIKGNYVTFLYEQICDFISDHLSYNIRVIEK